MAIRVSTARVAQAIGNSSGGTIAGARMDQNTFMLDGGDATATWREAAAQYGLPGYARA